MGRPGAAPSTGPLPPRERPRCPYPRKYQTGFAPILKDAFSELGGEGVGWKTQWATRETPVYQIEFALKSWKGKLWSIGQRLKGLVASGGEEKPGQSETIGGPPS